MSNKNTLVYEWARQAASKITDNVDENVELIAENIRDGYQYAMRQFSPHVRSDKVVKSLKIMTGSASPKTVEVGEKYIMIRDQCGAESAMFDRDEIEELRDGLTLILDQGFGGLKDAITAARKQRLDQSYQDWQKEHNKATRDRIASLIRNPAG